MNMHVNSAQSLSTLRSLQLRPANGGGEQNGAAPIQDQFVAGEAPVADPKPEVANANKPATTSLPQVGDQEQKEAAQNATFNIQEMQTLLDGPHKAAKDKIKNILSAPLFSRPPENISKEDYRELVLTWCKELAKPGNEMGSMAFPTKYGGKEDMGANIAAFETLAHFDLSLLVKFGVQMGLWGGSVYNLGTEKHHKEFLPGVMSLETPGCFAMTETGHGSNVQGIETVARYDKATDSFVIDSTTPGARKDYIGNAAAHGKFATVFAQLEVDGENEGVHALIVPIRDDDGNAMPGVTITDCGEKKGLNGVDNGRLFFENVSVPRDNLLDRFGGVDENGVYQSDIESKNKRFFTMIGTLITGRVSIGAGANATAKNGLATAIRYAEQRVQFGEPEQKLMDYTHHQKRLLPALAKTYALDFAVKDLIEDYTNVTDETRRDVGELAGGIKMMASDHANETLQECREACGGQGYLAANRFSSMQEDVDIFATFEGDNTILKQLVAKGALTKMAKRGILGNIWKATTDFFEHAWEKNPINARRTSEEHLTGAEFHRDAFEYRMERTQAGAVSKLRSAVKAGASKEEAGNLAQEELLAAGQAYTEMQVLNSFLKAVDKAPPGLKPALDQLCDLYALSTIEENKGFFLEESYFSPTKSKAVSEQVLELCRDVRPNAVALVDSFGIPDKCLDAPIAHGRIPA